MQYTNSLQMSSEFLFVFWACLSNCPINRSHPLVESHFYSIMVTNMVQVKPTEYRDHVPPQSKTSALVKLLIKIGFFPLTVKDGRISYKGRVLSHLYLIKRFVKIYL